MYNKIVYKINKTEDAEDMNVTRAIQRVFGQKPVSVEREPLAFDSGVSNRIASPRAGVMRYRIISADGAVRSFVGKSKTMAIIANGIRLLSGGDIIAFLLLVLEHKALGYNDSSVREVYIYRALAPELSAHVPVFIGAYTDSFTKESFLAMEELPSAAPRSDKLTEVIDIITEFHARYYGDVSAAEQMKLNNYSPRDYKRIRSRFRRMLQRLHDEDTEIFGEDKLAVIERFIGELHIRYAEVSFHRTLTHNDLSPRNISAYDGDIRIYDWELAAYQNPEHDIIELLISMLHELSDEQALSALHHHREVLAEKTGVQLTDEQYCTILRFNTLELCINKLCMLRLAGKHLGLDYTEQLAINAARMMDILNIT